VRSITQVVPTSAAEGTRNPPTLRRLAHSDGMGAMTVLVLAPCHAIGRAPRLTLSA